MLTIRHKASPCVFGVVAVLGFVAAGLGVWMWAPGRAATVRTIATGAGFNVTVVRSRFNASPMAIASRVEASGLPAFTRDLGNGRQVVVGPYVSIDEAEGVQRILARQGFGARLLVDESVRRVETHNAVADTSGSANVLLIAGGGRLSIVIEMPVEPRRVLTRDLDVEGGDSERVHSGGLDSDSVGLDSDSVGSDPVGSDSGRSDSGRSDSGRVPPVRLDSVRRGGPSGPPDFSTLEIDAGPVPPSVNSGRWNAPAGVALFHDLSIEHVGHGDSPSIRIRISVSKSAGTNVRVAGRRLYVDLWSLETTRRPAAVARVAATAETSERATEDYRVTIGPVVAKFDAIEPFMLAALGSPTPDVLSALERTLQSLDGWIRTISPPQQWEDPHYSLLSAVVLATDAVSPEFTGDRGARAREAFARRDTAKATLGN